MPKGIAIYKSGTIVYTCNNIETNIKLTPENIRAYEDYGGYEIEIEIEKCSICNCKHSLDITY